MCSSLLFEIVNGREEVRHSWSFFKLILRQNYLFLESKKKLYIYFYLIKKYTLLLDFWPK